MVSIVERGKPRPGSSLEVVGEEFFALTGAVGLPDLFERLKQALPINAIATQWPGSVGLEWAAAFKPLEQRWAINRSEVEAALRRSALARGIVVAPADNNLQVHNHDGLIVDATGRAAAVARRKGARLLPIADLIAISCNGRMDRPAMPIIEAVPDGWWFAVGEADHTVVTYFTDAVGAAHIRSPVDLAARLASTELLVRSIELNLDGTLSRSSAVSSYLEPGAGAGWAAVGDALLARDPLTSYGLTFAVQSALHLADAYTAKGFIHDIYLQPIDVAIARYRIARQRLYLAGTAAFDRPFWHAQAFLASQGSSVPASSETGTT
ncbi:hypothetical protein [Azospirillum palustre]